MALDMVQSVGHGFSPQTVFAVLIIEQKHTKKVYPNPVSCVGCANLLTVSAQRRNHNLLYSAIKSTIDAALRVWEATSPFIKALGDGCYTVVRKDGNCLHFFGFRFHARLIKEGLVLVLQG